MSRGNYLACVLDNTPWFPVLLAAATRLGVVLCPLSLRWPQKNIVERLSSIPVRHLIAAQSAANVSSDLIHLDGLIEDAQSATDSDPDADDTRIDSNQPVTVIFTSGSGGSPKAVLHTYGNHHYNALGSNDNIPIGERDRWLIALPFHHVGGIGILYRAMLSGGAIVLRNSDRSLADQIVHDDVTHLSLVYTQLVRLMDEQDGIDRIATQLKAVLLGGSGWPESTVYLAVQQGLPIHTTYGLTEMASQVTTSHKSDLPERLKSSGRALPHRDIRISDDKEIFVSGKTLCAGYVNPDGSIESIADEHGWFHTGDLGRLDASGYLYVKGRKDYMFISGGENIQPEQIAAALYQINGVERALVVPLTH